MTYDTPDPAESLSIRLALWAESDALLEADIPHYSRLVYDLQEAASRLEDLEAMPEADRLQWHSVKYDPPPDHPTLQRYMGIGGKWVYGVVDFDPQYEEWLDLLALEAGDE